MSGSHVRVGPRQRHLAIPDGWELLSPLLPMAQGDMHADIYRLAWDPIDDEDVGQLPWQEAVIRKKEIQHDSAGD